MVEAASEVASGHAQAEDGGTASGSVGNDVAPTLSFTLSNLNRDNLWKLRRVQEVAVREAQGKEASRRTVLRRGLKRCTRGADPMAIMTALGLISFVLCLVAGVVMVAMESNTGTGMPRKACTMETLGAKPGIAAKPWAVEVPQWTFGTVASGMFIIRRYLLTALADLLYKDLSDDKRAKVANYLLELLGTSVGLILLSLNGYWDLLFYPSDYAAVTDVDRLYNLTWSMNITFCLIVSMYLFEIAFDNHMRFALMLHHWLTIVMSLWGFWVVGIVNGDLMALRTIFAFLLYSLTEGNVFVSLLLYQRKINFGFLYTVSAWYYLITRFFITALVFWSWPSMHDAVFRDYAHNSLVAYSLFPFIGVANLILNGTQLTTVVNLFGIAKRVRHRAKETSKQRQLVEVFNEIDFDQSGGVSLEEWTLYVQSILSDILLPHRAYELAFNAMDIDKNGDVDKAEFVAHFEPLMTLNSRFAQVAKVCLLVALVEDGNISELETDLYRSHIEQALYGEKSSTTSKLVKMVKSRTSKDLVSPRSRVVTPPRGEVSEEVKKNASLDRGAATPKRDPQVHFGIDEGPPEVTNPKVCSI